MDVEIILAGNLMAGEVVANSAFGAGHEKALFGFEMIVFSLKIGQKARTFRGRIEQCQVNIHLTCGSFL